jgi:hypothetical protein
MRNKIFAIIVIVVSFILSSCSNSGSFVDGNTLPSSFLTLAAPSSYPTQSVAVTAYLSIMNNAKTAVNGLNFVVANNTTGVMVTVANGLSNPCYSIAASSSCVFPVTIAANSQPGSFTVNITAPTSSKMANIKNKIKTALGFTPSTDLSATVGVINVAATTLTGANGITFLARSTIAANIYGNTQQIITAIVNSPNAGKFNTLNLTDASGNLLHFSPLSGNSGAGVSNLAQNAIVTLRLTIPTGVTSLTYYAQTAENTAGDNNYKQGSVKPAIHGLVAVSQGTTPYTTIIKSAGGILNVNPVSFNLNSAHTTQILSYSNSGNVAVNALSITPSSPITKSSSTCGSTLAVNATCTYTVKFDAATPGSGNANVTASYNDGQNTVSSVAEVTYSGVSSESGLTISSGDNPSFIFTSQTNTPTASSQITLTNTGTGTESNISFTLPEHFSLSHGSSNSCDLSGSNVTNSLNSSSSCNLTLTYTNSAVTTSNTATLTVNYAYSGTSTSGNGSNSVSLTYATVQSSAALNITPSSQNFATIANNGLESSNYNFTVSNASSDMIATGVTPLLTSNDAALFSIVHNGCSNSIAACDSCIITVRFGSTTANPGNKTAQLQVVYVPYSSAIPISSTANLSGTVRLSNSANVTASFSANGFASGSGPGDLVNDSYQVVVNQNAAVSVVYTNSGSDTANNFTTTANISTPWSLSNHGCNHVNLAINGGSCTDVYTINSSTSGQNNFNYANIAVSFNDESGSAINQEIIPASGSTTYVNVYINPYVTVGLSSSTSGTPQIESSEINTISYLVYNLFGGYQVASGNYTATSAVTSGNGGTLSVGSGCNLSSTTPSCSVNVNSGTLTSGATTYTLTPHGDLTPIPLPSPLILTVYTPAIVNAYLSSESGTLNQISSVITNSTFYLYYTLSGGYPGETFSYTPILPPGMTIIGATSCTVANNAGLATCVITVSSGSNLGSGSINFGASSGGVTPTPISTSITVNPQNVYFGTSAGTVYENGTLLPGNGSMLMPDGGGVTSIAVYNGHVYAGTAYNYNSYGDPAGNVWVESGSTWYQFGDGSITSGYISAITVSDGTVYAGTRNNDGSGNVWYSSGGAWAKFADNSFDFPYPIASIIESSGTVYVATASLDSPPIGNVYASSGNTWTLFGLLHTDERINSITISGDTVYKGTELGRVWYSSGGDWVDLNDLHALDGGEAVNSVVAANNTIYAGTSNGIVWESSANTWESVCSGQVPNGGDHGITSVTVTGSDIYAGTKNNDVWLCDGSDRWVLESGSYLGGALDNSGNGSGNTHLSLDGNKIYAGTATGNVWVKLLSANTWSGAVLGSLDNSQVNSVAVCGNNICAGTAAGNVWAWSGSSWVQLSGNGYANSLDGTSSAYSAVNSIAASGNNTYAGTTNGNVWVWSGTNWNLFGASDMLDGSSVNAVTIANNNVYASTANSYVWKYSGSWDFIGGQRVPGGGVLSLAVSGNNVYVGTSNGDVFISTNNGSWSNLGNLSNLNTANGVYIFSLTIYGNNLYASGNGGGGCGYVWLWSGGPSWTIESGNGADCPNAVDNFSIAATAVSNIGTVYAGAQNVVGYGGGNLWMLPESSVWINTGYNGNPASSSVNTITTGP